MAVALTVAALIATPVRVRACDLCSIYVATEMKESRTGLQLGVSEQFTRFKTLRFNGEKVANDSGERMNSSVTQLLVAYNVTPRFGLQLTLPLISRNFRRRSAAGIDLGRERGIGDASLLARWTALAGAWAHGTFRVSVLGGVKLPTGNSRRLREELEEEVESGIHGHDLALGSGSLDGVVGATLFASRQRLFASATLQYVIRTQGDFDYEYADDLAWSGGPGLFLWLAHGYTLAAQAMISGEAKGKDRLSGQRADDTALTALYIGPRLAFTRGSSFDVQLALDLPLIQHNSDLQIVPAYRLRGGFVWRF